MWRLHCFVILRNGQDHPSLQHPPPDQSAAANMEERPSTSKKVMTQKMVSTL